MPRSFRLLTVVVVASCLGLAACGGTKHHPAATPTSTASSPTASPTVAAPKPTCPLTGLVPTGGQDRGRAALAVKVDNINPARPQAGLDRADVVVEELVEGGLTRLFAVFQCDSASSVGPIRSARTSDADLLALLHGSVFGFSGSNPDALPPIRAHGDAVLISYDALPAYYHRVSSRPAPHNVFSSTSTILTAGLARRPGLKAPEPLFTYSRTIPPGAKPATGVALTWPAASASWRWTGSSWARTQNGTPDVLTNGARVRAANVVVMSIALGSTGLRDVLGNASPLDITIGSHTVWVFRDGKVIKGTWRRASIKAPLRFYDTAGKRIALHPGKTWIELLPLGRLPAITVPR